MFFSAIFVAAGGASPHHRHAGGDRNISQTGLVPRLPTAVLATGLMLLAFLSLTCGLILDTVTRGRWEAEAHGLSRHSRPACDLDSARQTSVS